MKILLAIDGSPGSDHAVELLAGIPPLQGARVEVLHVVECEAPFSADADVDPEEREALDQITAKLETEARSYLEAATARLNAAGWSADERTRKGAPAAEILAAAEESAADVTLLGATGQHGNANGSLGRTVRRILKNSTGAVLIARERSERTGPLHLLFPFDDSEGALVATETVGRLRPACASITLLSVLTVATTLYRYDIAERMSATWRAHKERVEASLEALATRIRSDGLEVAVRVLDGGTDAADEILEATRLLLPDITVVGHSGKGSLKKLVLGSVSEALAERAPCSVWIAAAPPE